MSGDEHPQSLPRPPPPDSKEVLWMSEKRRAAEPLARQCGLGLWCQGVTLSVSECVPLRGLAAGWRVRMHPTPLRPWLAPSPNGPNVKLGYWVTVSRWACVLVPMATYSFHYHTGHDEDVRTATRQTDSPGFDPQHHMVT